MPSISPARFRPAVPALAAALLLTATAANADWLVTRQGTRVETRGPWKVEKGQVVFTDAQGRLASLRLAEVDLAASKAATEAAAAASRAPKPAPAAPPQKPSVAAITDADVAHKDPAQKDPAVQKAQVILYSTAWCGYCRKTRELLHSLQIPFVEKDIEKSAEGRAEYQAKGKGYRGVPLTDIGGTLVKGYVPDEVKRLVEALPKKDAAASTR